MNEKSSFTAAGTASQQFTILQPKVCVTFLMPVKEWKFLKNKISNIRDCINWFQTIGVLFVGVTLSTLITAIRENFKDVTTNFITVYAFTISVLLLIFRWKRSKDQGVKIKEVTEQMNFIEEKYCNNNNDE